MNSKKVLSTVIAAILLTSPFAWGQGDSPGANYYDREQNQRLYDREQAQRRYERDRRDYDGRQWSRNDNREYGRQQRDARGAGPNHSYFPGGYLPPQYRTRHYVVEDWRGHQLSAPPSGYQWVQSGSDYLLVAIATGVILGLILNN